MNNKGEETPNYATWNIIISKKAGAIASHFGERCKERGLIQAGHFVPLAYVKRFFDPKNGVITEDNTEGRKKSIFKWRDIYGKMRYWTMIFQPNPKLKVVYVVTLVEAKIEEIQVYRYQRGV
jgi:hypothetical protein